MPVAALKLAELLGSRGIAKLSWSTELTADELHDFVALLSPGRSPGARQEWQDASCEHLSAEGPDYETLLAHEDEGDEWLSAERLV